MRSFQLPDIAAVIFSMAALASPALAQSGGAPASTQSIDAAVRVPIDQLFAGMKARDTTMIIDAFVSTGRLIDIRDRNGATTVSGLAPADFARSLLRAPVGDLVERIWDVEVKADGNVANAWAKYDFHIGERFSHCGVDAFQLARTHAGWKIVQIMDTRQMTGCSVPPK
ncbi:MAG: hypothetical protein ABIV28_00480 [Longimicrobiales bacterium]